MPLPHIVSCSSKIQIGFTFLVPAHLGSPGQKAVKWVCKCVCFYYKNTLKQRNLKQYFNDILHRMLHTLFKICGQCNLVK